ncbi:MAG: hypothetical protein PWQ84_1696 [Thermotogaceae bacterium]|nr:hypothetical protein [Thermotogaceae bacterium]
MEQNTTVIHKVKDECDFKSVLTNFHQLSYAKITELASETVAFDFYDNSGPSEGYSTFIADFKNNLDDSVFSGQWDIIKDNFDGTSNHALLLSYSTTETNSNNSYINSFSTYIDTLDLKDKIDNCESIVVELDNSDRKALVINKLQLVSGEKQFSAALFQKSHYNKYLYFTEVENDIWFTDGDVVNGPLATLGTLHISGNPIFNGTVYYNPDASGGAFEYYDEDSEGVYNGEPGTEEIDPDVTFSDIANKYKKKLEKNFVSFSDFMETGETVLEVSDISDNSWGVKYYTISVPATCTRVIVNTFGGTGNADLYIRRNHQPTTNNYLEKSENYNNNEKITLKDPQTGTYIIGVYAWSNYSGLNLKVTFFTKEKALFGFSDFASYTAIVPEEEQIDFKNTQALKLDYNSTDYNIDIDDNKIIVNWRGKSDSLQIIHSENTGNESTYEATYIYNDGVDTYTTSGIPFSGFITTEDKRIYLGDHNNSNSGDLCYYDGKLTFHTSNKIYIEDSFIPSELQDFEELNYTEKWNQAQNNRIVDFYDNNNVDSSLNIVTDDYIYIGSGNEYAKENQKIFASLYSFDGKIEVMDYDWISVKDQLTVFGSMMQKERGAVGQFTTTSVKKTVYTNSDYYRYKFFHGIVQGRYWGQSKWYDLFDYSDIDETLYYKPWNRRHYIELYYYVYETVTTSGFYKNYIFDPRFSRGYTPANGAPQDDRALDIIFSGIIEVF